MNSDSSSNSSSSSSSASANSSGPFSTDQIEALQRIVLGMSDTVVSQLERRLEGSFNRAQDIPTLSSLPNPVQPEEVTSSPFSRKRERKSEEDASYDVTFSFMPRHKPNETILLTLHLSPPPPPPPPLQFWIQENFKLQTASMEAQEKSQLLQRKLNPEEEFYQNIKEAVEVNLPEGVQFEKGAFQKRLKKKMKSKSNYEKEIQKHGLDFLQQQSRRRTRKHRKMASRKKAVKDSDDQELAKMIEIPELHSSEYSEGEGENVKFQKHPLPWRSEELSNFVGHLDERIEQGRSLLSKKMSTQRTIGEASPRRPSSYCPQRAIQE